MHDHPYLTRRNLIVLIVVFLLLASVGTVWLRHSRQLAQRVTCADHLRKLGQGMSAFEAAQLHFPVETIAPNLGFRVQLLPFIDQVKLYDELQLAVAGGVLMNDHILAPYPCPAFFQCPSQPKWTRPFLTSSYSGNFFISLGQGVPNHESNGFCGSKVSDFTDGLAHTVALAEFVTADPEVFDARYSGYIYKLKKGETDMTVAKQKCFQSKEVNQHRAIDGTWVYSEQMESTYIHALTPNLRQCVNMGSPSSNHGDGVHLLFADGHDAYFANDVDPNVWWSMASRSGDKIGAP